MENLEKAIEEMKAWCGKDWETTPGLLLAVAICKEVLRKAEEEREAELDEFFKWHLPSGGIYES